MKKGKKIPDVSLIDWIGQGAAYLYLIGMLFVFPLYYRRDFSTLSRSKIFIFTAASAMLVLLCAVPLGLRILSVKRMFRERGAVFCDVFVLIFAAGVCCSGLVSVNRQESLHPTMESYIGIVVMLLCAAVYFCLRCFGKVDTVISFSCLLGSGGIYLWGILLNCKVNLFHIRDRLAWSSQVTFISPIGNINYNAAYLSLMLPFGFILYLTCRKKLTEHALRLYLFLGFLDMFLIRSDSIYGAMAAALAVLLYFALGDAGYFQRFCEIISILSLGGIATFLLYQMIPERMYGMSGIGGLFLKPFLPAVELFFMGIALWLGPKYSPEEETCRRLQRAYLGFLAGLAAAAVAGFVLVNVFFRDRLSETALDFLLLKDSFGSGRGYIWRRVPKVYAGLPFWNKIFGCGPNCFYEAVRPYYGQEQLERFGVVFYTAHNDFLHFLLETGIVGVTGYFGMIFATIGHALKRRRENPSYIGVVVMLCSYLVQGLVNQITIFVFPLLFILMGCANSSRKSYS